MDPWLMHVSKTVLRAIVIVRKVTLHFGFWWMFNWLFSELSIYCEVHQWPFGFSLFFHLVAKHASTSQFHALSCYRTKEMCNWNKCARR